MPGAVQGVLSLTGLKHVVWGRGADKGEGAKVKGQLRPCLMKGWGRELLSFR